MERPIFGALDSSGQKVEMIWKRVRRILAEANLYIESAVMSPCWTTVFSIALGVASMIAAELLPFSLLTLMTRELSMTEGLTGKTIAITAFIVIFTSFFVSTWGCGINRWLVVIALSIASHRRTSRQRICYLAAPQTHFFQLRALVTVPSSPSRRKIVEQLLYRTLRRTSFSLGSGSLP